MSREDILKKVEEIFQDIFDEESLSINNDTKAEDIEDWDSLNHINLVSAIEKNYKIRFALGELSTLKNVGAMVDLIIAKI